MQPYPALFLLAAQLDITHYRRSERIRVLPAVTYMITQLVSSRWETLLTDYHDQLWIDEILHHRTTNSFRISFNYLPEPLVAAKKNMYCVMQHQEIVNQYACIAEESLTTVLLVHAVLT